jgi:PhnB protein
LRDVSLTGETMASKMITLNPYLTFIGNCEEAFNFYKSIFGGEFQFLGRYKDVPEEERKTFKDEDDEKIMHVSLPINKDTTLMGCDSQAPFGHTTEFGSNISLALNTDSRQDADRLFKGLSADGQIKMDMNETFWGAYFGMVKDKFGIQWMINCELIQHQHD